MNEERIIESLKDVLSLSENTIIFSLPGGTVNKAYLLNDDSNDFMVKVFVGNDEFNIDRRERFVLQQRLATRKLAPKPLFLSEDKILYAEQWVHQTKSQIPLFFDELHLDSLARTLAKIHNCSLNTPVLDLPAAWQFYIDKVKAEQIDIQGKFTQLSEKWQVLENTQVHHRRMCHNDLSWSHICGATGLVLDWEYAAMGNRFFDLMSCAKINQLDMEQLKILLKSYSKHSNIRLSEVESCCHLQTDLVDFSYELWFQVLRQSVAE